MNNYVKVKGIVLSETDYSESSKILNVLTEEYGLIGIISKGCKSLKSKLRAYSMKLSYSEFTIKYKENGLSTLIEANTINSLKNIFLDLKKINYSNYIIDIINQVLKENNNKKIFYLLEQCLIKINENLDPEILINIVEIQLLKYLGVELNLSECVLCGSKDIKTLDINKGGLICNNCYTDEILFTPKVIKILMGMNKVDLKNIDHIDEVDPRIKEEIDNLIYEFYDVYTGIYIKKKDNIKKLINRFSI